LALHDRGGGHLRPVLPAAHAAGRGHPEGAAVGLRLQLAAAAVAHQGHRRSLEGELRPLPVHPLPALRADIAKGPHFFRHWDRLLFRGGGCSACRGRIGLLLYDTFPGFSTPDFSLFCRTEAHTTSPGGSRRFWYGAAQPRWKRLTFIDQCAMLSL